MSVASVFPGEDPKSKLGRIAKLLEDNEIDLEEIGAIEKVRLNEWEGLTKNADGEAEVTTLRAASLILSPKWATGPQWPVVQQARPTNIKPVEPRPVKRSRGWGVAVVLPDPQVGYRRLSDESLDPFHDEAAMRVALRICASLQPDRIINSGDLVDFPEFSKYLKEPAFALTTQATLDRAHEFLAEQRASCPEAEIELLEGNHDKRLPLSIIANASAAFGIRQAKAPDTWPVLSVPHLLRLEDLGVSYVGGYPNGRTWINENVCCAHGPSKYRGSGSSAAASIDDERVSVIFGHVHRIELQHKTRNVREGAKQNLMASPGCLCRIDGAVPSTKSSFDDSGAPILHYENWQQGLAVVTYKKGDGPFNVELVPIHEGTAIFRGETFRA